MILPPSQVWRQTAPHSKAFKLLSTKNGLGGPVLPGTRSAKGRWDTRQARRAVSGFQRPFWFPLPHGRPNTVVPPAATVSVRCARHRCDAAGGQHPRVLTEQRRHSRGPGRGPSTEEAEQSYFVHRFISLMLFYFTALLLSGKA